jgi:hypothetical protein
MLQNFKISFYVNSHTNKLFKKRKMVGQFVNVGFIVWRDDRCGTSVKGIMTVVGGAPMM